MNVQANTAECLHIHRLPSPPHPPLLPHVMLDTGSPSLSRCWSRVAGGVPATETLMAWTNPLVTRGWGRLLDRVHQALKGFHSIKGDCIASVRRGRPVNHTWLPRDLSSNQTAGQGYIERRKGAPHTAYRLLLRGGRGHGSFVRFPLGNIHSRITTSEERRPVQYGGRTHPL